MTHEQSAAPAYFDTPARAERLQLLLHLVRNVGEVIYLRAPAGAGKTRFAHQLLDILDADMASVWIRGGEDTDVAATAADQLGLPTGYAADWPNAVLEVLGDQQLLVVVDDADDLGLPALERLAVMHARGGRLLLLGQGGLAHTNRDWDVQFVDLPAFDRAETTAFLRSQAGAAADRVDDDLVAALHQAAHGMPGPLLDALGEVLSRAKRRPSRAPRPASVALPRRFGWQWLAGGAVVVLLVGLLVFQDQVNSLFESGGGPVEPGLVEKPPAVPAIEPPAPVRQIPAESPVPIVDAEATPVDSAMVAAEPPPVPPAAGEAADVRPAETPDALEAVMQDALSAARAEPADGAAQAADDVVVAAVTPQAPATPTPAPTGPVSASPDADALPAAEEDRPEEPATTPTAAGPAPVEERAAAGPSAAKTTRPGRASGAGGIEVSAASGGAAWLEGREPRRYTLQLVGARDRDRVEHYAREHQLAQPYAVFERRLDGRPWYSLVVGDYPDRAAAVAARDRLPAGVAREGVWPRTFESIFKSQ